MRHPSRVPTWDAIVLTAASPEQAELYEWQLKRAKRLGRIASSTVTLVVPDPDGNRIGSGGATLNAIHALARHLEALGPQVFQFWNVVIANAVFGCWESGGQGKGSGVSNFMFLLFLPFCKCKGKGIILKGGIMIFVSLVFFFGVK